MRCARLNRWMKSSSCRVSALFVRDNTEQLERMAPVADQVKWEQLAGDRRNALSIIFTTTLCTFRRWCSGLDPCYGNPGQFSGSSGV